MFSELDRHIKLNSARFSRFIYLTGIALNVLAVQMLLPALYGLYLGSKESFAAFTASFLITGLIGGCFMLGFRGNQERFERDMMVFLPTFLFVGLALFGSLPIYWLAEHASFLQAFYESLSMVTTSGASVLELEGADNEVLYYWRALLAWSGGFIAIMLILGVLAPAHFAGYHLHVSRLVLDHGKGKESLFRSAILALFPLYLLVTLVIMLVMLVSGIGLFDSFQIAAAIVSLTGLPIQSLGELQSSGLIYLIIPFLFISGLNWDVMAAKARKRRLSLLSDPESRSFTFSLMLIFVFAWLLFGGLAPGLFLPSLMAVLSAITGFGWMPGNFDDLSVSLFLLGAAFIGASAYCAGGGLKQVRVLSFSKIVTGELSRLSYPNAILKTSIGKVPLSPSDIEGLWLLLSLLLITIIIGVIGLVTFGLDFASALMNVLAHIVLAAPLVETADTSIKAPGLLFDAELGVLAFVLLMGRVETTILFAMLGRRFWTG